VLLPAAPTGKHGKQLIVAFFFLYGK